TIAVIGIGVIGIRRTINSTAPSAATNFAAEGTTDLVNTGPQPRSKSAAVQPGGNDAFPETRRSSNAAELEDAKNELRALLQHPPANNGYPPPRLLRVLAKFGREVQEAVPILLEALNTSDYETRAWALSGLRYVLEIQRGTPGGEDRADQMFALARPALRRVLRSADEPDMLRMIAVLAYLPGTVYANGIPTWPPALSAESVDDLIAAVRTPEKKKSRDFRFTIVDHLTGYFSARPDTAQTFANAIKPLLSDPQPGQSLLAAYALASWPGEKPVELKEIFLAELKDKTTYSFRAASGLGKLRADAADAVPDLLAYAEATRSWGAGYSKAALEAACRIQPELRSQYPETDASLQQEETALAQMANPRPTDLAAELADPERGPALREGMLSQIKDSPEPETAKRQLLQLLEATLAKASDDRRDAIQNALDIVRGATRQANSRRQKGQQSP
ncbi:MAG: hypothetical protein L0Z50_41140, partial [Verrucomicrobiales bacterium]|nr:hypothetical protein [Verrucomicrobiales bacterium]